MHATRQADQQAGDSDSSPAVSDSTRRPEGSVNKADIERCAAELEMVNLLPKGSQEVNLRDLCIGQYADYAADVWDNTGRHYDLLKLDDLIAAKSCSDEFVRMMAREYAEKSDTCSCWPCIIFNREFHKNNLTWRWIRNTMRSIWATSKR
jgi:hypothetical protein